MTREVEGRRSSPERWIRTYPLADAAFAGHVADLIAREPIERPADLERILRWRYPRAVVRASELSGLPTASWYVYREGHWLSPTESGESAESGEQAPKSRDARESREPLTERVPSRRLRSRPRRLRTPRSGRRRQ